VRNRILIIGIAAILGVIGLRVYLGSEHLGLWVAIGGQLLRLDLDLRTNLAVTLPIDASVPITALCLLPSKVWIGTQGAGLIELDKMSHQCRHFTEADGLLMNDIASLEPDGDTLWIGYGGATGGGLGRMDLLSGKLNSFTPSINADAGASTSEPPPRGVIGKIVAGGDGNLWLFVGNDIRQFHVKRNVWETLPRQTDGWVYSFCADSKYLVEGVSFDLLEIGIQNKIARNTPANDLHRTNIVVTRAELRLLQTNLHTNGSHRWVSSIGIRDQRRGAVAIQNLNDHHWQTLEDADGFPNPPSAVTLDGDNLWVGGEGTIALVDLKENKVKKFCHINADAVDRIQIAGGYVWAQFDGNLYRAPLSELQ
jgi:ligand-binding sensor domain-containing protein